MKKSTIKWMTLVAIVSILLFQATVFAQNDSQTSQNNNASTDQTQVQEPAALQDLNDVFQLLSNYHVSGTSQEKLSESAVQGMIQALDDPYTVYFSKEQYQQFENGLEENYVGIGIQLGHDQNGYFVEQVFEGSPAQKAGMEREDYITKVAGNPVKTIDEQKLVSLIKGPAGTSVVLTLQRGDKTLDVTVGRAQIQLPVVTSKWFPDQIGYIKIDTFSSTAGDLFNQQLANMKQKKIRGLVIDLRNNPGGLLQTAENIASQFIQQGTLIHTADRNQVDNPITITNGKTVSFPVVVLVNQNSASASEILTGALQDYHVGTAVGTKTFGKGSVQTVIPLHSGGVLKVTIEHYFTPNHRKVNKVGLQPDYVVSGAMEQLITGMYLAGEQNISLNLLPHETKLNGQNFNETVHFIEGDHHLYVPVRLLSSLIQAEVKWDGDTHAVEIDQGDSHIAYAKSSSALKMLNGTNYIDLDTFQAKFPQLHYSYSNHELDLKVEKGMQ